MNATQIKSLREPLNKGKLVGQKVSLKLRRFEQYATTARSERSSTL